jgi:hypothetical protein
MRPLGLWGVYKVVESPVSAESKNNATSAPGAML